MHPWEGVLTLPCFLCSSCAFLQAFFDDKVANLLGSKQGRASLSKLMSLEAREREVASLESQKADLVKNAEALQKKMEAYETQKANVDKRETEVEHLNGQIEMAIAEAAEEQSLFEASVESRNEELNQRKKQLDAFWLEIKDQVEVSARQSFGYFLYQKSRIL
jgi:chromosome segregation ATPase